jgi:hypothetical protein
MERNRSACCMCMGVWSCLCVMAALAEVSGAETVLVTVPMDASAYSVPLSPTFAGFSVEPQVTAGSMHCSVLVGVQCEWDTGRRAGLWVCYLYLALGIGCCV